MPRTETRASTDVQTEVGVSTWTNTLNYVANESVMFLMDYIDHRGLGIEKFTEMREELEDALWTLLASRHLRKVIVEVYRNDTGELVERFDLSYNIQSPGDMSQEEIEAAQEKRFESYHEDIVDALSEYDAPPAGCTYRVLLGLRAENDAGADPPELPNWGEATPKSTEGMEANDLGDAIDAGPIDTAAELWI